MTAHIVGVASRFPPNYYSQEELTAVLRDTFWRQHFTNVARLERLHRNVQVEGRYLALPLAGYQELDGFHGHNEAWIQVATALGEETLCALLDQTGLPPHEIAALVTTTVTGVAVPSLDARLMNRIPFSPHLKRIPLFGLGCLGGAAGAARVADYLQGHPAEAAILLAVELCSLTLQPEDLSIANIIASGLFGDGAAALLMVGQDHPLARPGQPQVIANRSFFFPETERIMGWDVTNTGFQVVLSADVPEIARTHLPPCVDTFLAQHALERSDIACWVAHPGGPKVMEAMEEGLGLEEGTLHLSRKSLFQFGNISSVSVLLVLQETLRGYHPEPGSYGLMLAMGPGFGAELLLLRW
ncbi:MAG: type III polyketide synthase [Chloroflexi bacterium]|nr:type III polyketide synthase [Chloroflexota bacterium]MCI0576919.1 type III polyketide synthase [Chloroflexota bacterium]MCI0649693.1 type III polyketide synthase [Chloroflexota bacterium]MCI0729944.1 type III polyketide synthase [Chloroflexota bacterium]